ncbi:Biuret hydrolase [Burkholderia pseudomultivorans]|uniref:Biuret hydrolase n=2 Tax=Burkholderia pseudomultivorans TaxID=1207504 RepID=A0ABU2E3N6_9BURK|nr:Biuret hydrolase [Burkholderia pseudomultivorans]MDR8737004.1 Biuret hydrolase [Burkholderia pseudomultivorans]MDR8743101.1 Biuret hydrolase [Burkholderia pseudomultivorans]MDR8754476.1 Biuret hydrolase [Burkholderia pseudomultivorans]MDR8779829.1 Biuret hydrolase [Burkholderia pseudomultivorans]
MIMPTDTIDMRDALGIAQAVRAGRLSAVEVARHALDDIAARNAQFNAISTCFDTRALEAAAHIDACVRAGRDAGPLAGVSFAVKSNFDVAGYTTVAGSPTRLRAPAAHCDAAMVARLVQAGAVPVAATHMDEFACGATGVNPHFGAVRLPADTSRMTGGSSSGSAAAVAAGHVSLALGSDTNGSIRAPAALCGVWGIKPTHGRLSTDGCVPYATSLDVAGGFATNLDDLCALYHALSCASSDDAPGDAPLSVCVLTGEFERRADAHVRRAVERAAARFAQHDHVQAETMDESMLEPIRASARIVSNFEVARRHRALLDADASLVSAHLRERIRLGLGIADATYAAALAHRAEWQARLAVLFERFDVLIAPATPYIAPRFSDATVDVNGEALDPKATLGMFTQPISFAGLPVVSAPCHAAGELPAGVQLIGRPGDERRCLDAARRLVGLG